jgi:trehalose 6-phosphate synthase
MVISEFAGAAQSLNGSLVVNPWDSQQVADAIHEAVSMSEETRAQNHEKLFAVSFRPIMSLYLF